MANKKRNGSRRRSDLHPKGLPLDKNAGFRRGSTGVCEAQLWEFTGPSRSPAENEKIPIERVAATSVDQALKYMRRRHCDFIICKAEAIGMVAMLSGSPLD